MLNRVELEVLGLLPDFSAPLSVILPEVRQTMRAEIEEVMEAVRSLQRKEFISVLVCEPAGSLSVPSEEHYRLILSEYRTGVRDPGAVKQIFDRSDLWLEITDLGRRELFSRTTCG